MTVSELGDHGIELSLNVWVGKSDYFSVQPLLREIVKAALDASGIEIPYPQLDVHKA